MPPCTINTETVSTVSFCTKIAIAIGAHIILTLYGQAEGKEYTFGTAEIRRGTDNFDGSDQRGGMEQTVQDGTANASAFKRFDGTESRFEELGGELPIQ